MLEGYFYQGEIPSATTISDMLIKVVVAAECDSDDVGAEDLVSGLVKAWIGAVENALEEEDGDETDFSEHFAMVTERAAEKAYGDAYRKVYCQRVYGRKPQNDDELGWWPDCLNYKGSFPRKLLVKIARTLAAVEADRDRAGMRMAQEHFEEQKRSAC